VKALGGIQKALVAEESLQVAVVNNSARQALQAPLVKDIVLVLQVKDIVLVLQVKGIVLLALVKDIALQALQVKGIALQALQALQVSNIVLLVPVVQVSNIVLLVPVVQVSNIAQALVQVPQLMTAAILKHKN
jgi:hypothetical protein